MRSLFFSLVQPWLLLWKHRSLLWQFTHRQIEVRHRGSYLGVIWTVLNPLLMLGLYVFVFGFVFGGSFGVLEVETKFDYAIGIFLGLIVFHVFSETLALSPMIILGQPSLVKRVVFPLEILPVSGVLVSLYHMMISLVLLIIGVTFWGPGLSLQIVWAPLILIPVILMCLGIAWFVSAVGVFLRDMNQVIGFCGMGLLFASGVFYPASSIPEAGWAVLKYNPVLQAIDLMRDSFLWALPMDFKPLIFIWICGLSSAIMGFTVFAKLKSTFADII